MATITPLIKTEPETDASVTNVANSSNWQHVIVSEETVCSDEDLYSNKKNGRVEEQPQDICQVLPKFSQTSLRKFKELQEGIVDYVVKQEQSLDRSCIRERHVTEEQSQSLLRLEKKRFSNGGDDDDEDDQVYDDAGWQIEGSQSSGGKENGSDSTRSTSDTKGEQGDGTLEDKQRVSSMSTDSSHQELKCVDRDIKKVLDENGCSNSASTDMTTKCAKDNFLLNIGHPPLKHTLVQDEKGVPKKLKKCEVCGKSYLPKDMPKHMLFHSGVRNYPCSICDKRFFTKTHCRSHEKTHEKKKRTCPQCGLECVNLPGLRKHMRVHDQNGVCQVMKCIDSDTMKVLDEDGGINAASKDMTNKCAKDKSLFNIGNLPLQHVLVKDDKRVPKKRKTCEVCGKSYLLKDIPKHMLFHSGVRNYPCSICDKRSFTKAHCRSHEETHKKKNMFVDLTCPQCGRECVTLSGFRKHMRVHDQKGVCQDMKCVDSDTMKVLDEDGGINAASKDTTNNCAKDKSLFNIGNLPLQHILVKDDKRVPKKRQTCEVCGKSYPPKDIPKHMLFHSGVRNYPCSLCDKRFFTKAHCRSHEETHKKKNVFVDLTCPQCGRECVTLSGFRKHMRVHDQKGVCQDMKCVDSDTMKVLDEDGGINAASKDTTNNCAKDKSLFNIGNLPLQHILVKDDKRVPKKRQTCEVCGKSYPPKDIPKHMLFHSGVRNYPCSLCDKRFFTKAHCRSHEETHNNTHKSTHKKLRESSNVFVKIICQQCDREFVNRSGLTRHMKVHDRKAVLDNMKCIDSDTMKVKGPTTDSIGERDDRDLEDKEKVLSDSRYQDLKCVDSGIMKLKRPISYSKGEQDDKTFEKLSSMSTESSHRDMKCVDSDTMKVLDEDCGINAASTDMTTKCAKDNFLFNIGHLPLNHTLVQDDKRVPKKLKKCEVCGKSYLPKDMPKHMLFHTGERNYPCSLCDKRFFTKAHCRSHEETHNNTHKKLHESSNVFVKIICQQCDREFVNRSGLTKHMKVHDRRAVLDNMKCIDSDTMKVKGPTTDSIGERDDRDLEDKEKVLSDRRYQDLKCVDSDIMKLKRPISYSKGEQDDKTFEKLSSMSTESSHRDMKCVDSDTMKVLDENGCINTASTDMTIKCAKDNSLFNIGHPPLKHTLVQDEKGVSKKLKKCEICGKCYLPKEMPKHMLFHTGERKYPCSLCDKRFFTKAHSRTHEQTHVFVDLTCPQCGRECVNLSGLRNHMRIHDRKEVGVDMKCINSDTMKVKGPTTDSKGERDDKALEDKEKVLSINFDSSHQDMKCVDSDTKKVLDENCCINATSTDMTTKCAKDNFLFSIEHHLPLKRTFVQDDKPASMKLKKCEVCGKCYISKRMPRHMLSHTGERNYPCSLCDKRFFTKAHCSTHQKTHEKKNLFVDLTCPQCGRECLNLSGLRKHIRFHDRKEVRADMKCVDGDTMKVLDEDDKRVPKKLKKCEVCGKSYLPKEMPKHMLFHTGERKYPCSLCDKRFFTKGHCRSHEKTHKSKNHMRVPDQQKVCEADSVAKHKPQYQDGKPAILCQKCGKMFKSILTLNSHMLIHSDVKDFECDICNKAFRHRQSLKAHQQIHTDQKPEFLCHECGKLFKTMAHLDSHMLIHSDVKGFICDICNKAFRHRLSLKFHKHIHSGDRPYVCAICKMAFFTVTDLKSHERTHTGKTLFKCPQCVISFSSKYSLNLHLETHSEPEPHDCHLCKSTFIVKRLLLRHLERFHGQEVKSADTGIVKVKRDKRVNVDVEVRTTRSKESTEVEEQEIKRCSSRSKKK